jgi:hypothetical protein
MEEKEYVSEDILQDLVAKYPNLLVGDEMDINVPRKWLLVQRELFLYCEDEYGLEKFYLDHLFLDQDGIPTIVETKLSSNNELRRQVVAQMLDYASNAQIYLPIEDIKTILTSTYPNRDQEELIKDKLGLEISPDEFWELVKTNLQAGKIRLVFVADIIPTKLRTIVEFLNIQMDPAEVYAVELKQYVGGGLKTLVTRLMGQTKEDQMRNIISNKKLDETTFFEQLDEDEAIFYRKLLNFAKENDLSISWGSKSFSLNIINNGNNINLLRGFSKISAYGQALFATVGNISNKVPNGESIVEEYIELNFANKVHDGYGFNVTEMDEEQTKRFYGVLSSIIRRIKLSGV